MYGTFARYRLKPGTEKRWQEFEAEVRKAQMPGLLAEYTFRAEEDACLYYETIIFESSEAYRVYAASPQYDARYRKLLELLEAPPEQHGGELVHVRGPFLPEA